MAHNESPSQEPLPSGLGADAASQLPDVDNKTDLETILGAWHEATVRLEQTHRVLRQEVGRLTSELETKNRELARKNRLADLGQMASHLAHEVRNNLVPVALYMSLLKRRLDADSESFEILEKVDAGVSALDVTVNDLLHFTSERDPLCGVTALSRLIDDVLASLKPQLRAQSIETSIDIPTRSTVVCDQDMLRRAVLNLVLNALDAMPNGGRLDITAYDSSDGLELEVADSGEGLSEESLNRAFEPFYTTKNRGTGLGLAIVYRVAEVHGGGVTAMNCPEGGAAFTIRLPRRIREDAA